MKLRRSQASVIVRSAARAGITPLEMLEEIVRFQKQKLEKLEIADKEIVSFSVGLRMCGYEPDNFEDDRALWLTKHGPVVRFRMPRRVALSGLVWGYRLGDIRRALRRWEERQQIATWANA